MHFIAQAVAVACSMSYAASNIAARLGMKHSNPVHDDARFVYDPNRCPGSLCAVVREHSASSLSLSLTLMPLVNRYQRPVWSIQAVKGLIIASLFENLGFVLFVTSFGLAPVATVSPMIASSPMWVVLAGLLIFRKRMSWQTIIGTVSTVGGTITLGH
jgi:drug/metabolite transporter (DMT)-like permease